MKSKLIKLPLVATVLAWTLVKGMAFRLVYFLGELLPSNTVGCRARGLIYRRLLKRCGRNFQVGLRVQLEHLNGIEMGDDVYIGYGCWISGLRGGIAFEDQVMLGPYVCMVSSNHKFLDASARFPSGVGAPIHVGFGTWIASGATITAGATIGKSCLIAAGCVVTKDVPDNTIVGGVPARRIGSVSNDTPNDASDAAVAFPSTSCPDGAAHLMEGKAR